MLSPRITAMTTTSSRVKGTLHLSLRAADHRASIALPPSGRGRSSAVQYAKAAGSRRAVSSLCWEKTRS